ncbi:exported hypothetical protein [Candidatus Nitrotoga sp. HW29]|uniref:InlB B-repeat-containing protein n=1 Tax=Candidatus Nitrotoga sp. HW29 TaxID=2886963 RepID=UPI001F8DE3B3|nr:hypothetical protein [Candidatus Nitrotoga sp. HW29]CAH1905237.1 exported hypothetical protein [Candidatus Nitrotoga sp. HW29]
MGLIIVKPFWRCLRAMILAAMTMATAFSAYAQVSVTPVTWNVVGLDSNNVNVGPNIFPVGVRVCNIGSTPLSGLKARYVWDSTSAYITRTSTEYLDIANLVAGTCQDIFHEVTVTRNAAAYTQAARYHIDVINGVNAVLASTPTPREIYVERLVSQNRNATDSILVNNTSVSGSTNVNEGQTYEIKLVGHTATQGYEQFEQFLNFRSDLFLVKSVKSTYTAAAGTDLLAGSKIYADGCHWVNDPTDAVTPSYRECQGGGKYGGSTTLTYVVEIKAGAAALAPTGVSINALLYDFSGSSYHYNADQSAAITFNFTNTPPPAEVDLAMAKSAVLSSPGNGEFTLTVTNTGSIGATNVVVTDTVPNGYHIKNSQPAAPAGTTLAWDKDDPDESLVWTIASLPAGSSISYTFSVQTVNSQTNYVNQACVAATETDPNTTNNCATAAVPVAQSDLALVKTASFTSPLKIGDSITFNVGVLNLGPSVGTGVVVSDTLPAGYSFTSASCASGWMPSNVGATHSCTATNVAVSTVPVTILTIVAQVLAPADPTNTTGYQNTASVASASNDPVEFNNHASAVAPPTFLTIAKVADAASHTSASPNGTYTLTVTKSGSSADLGTVSVQDVLPLGVSATSITGTGWTCSLATLSCTRPDDLTSGIPPSAAYPNIVIGVTFSGPSNPDVVNHANVISEKNGIVTSYDETTRSVSWANSAVYYTADATVSPVGGGSAACSPSSVLSGSNSVCTATPNTGYYFTGWTGSCVAEGTTTCNLNNVTANQSSVASFALLTYTVVATAGTGGSASCTPPSVLSGANSVCTATPNTGYYFTGWTGSCVAEGTTTCNLNNVTANQSSVATFALLTYTVVATAGTGGVANCVPSPVSPGGSATCTATAGAGSTFTGWTGACAGQSGPVCNLTGIAANMESTASFTAIVITGSVQAIPTLSGQLMIVMVFLMILAACAAIKAHARRCR